MYNALQGDAWPFELVTWTLAEKFGWTLEYIESLPLSRLHEYFQIEDGKAKAVEFMKKRK